MSKEIPPELHRVLRRLDDITSMHKEKLDFIQGRWATLRRKQPPDPEEVRRGAEREDASPELKAVAVAVRSGKTSWAKVVRGDADHLPEVQAFYTAHRERLIEEIQAARQQQPSAAPAAEIVAPARPRRARTELDGLDDREAAVFDTW